MLNNGPEQDETKENLSSAPMSDHSIASLPTVKEENNMSFDILNDEKKDCETIKKLFQDGFDLNAPDEEGYTPAHFAANDGHVEILQFLHELNADLINTPARDGFTPALIAAHAGQVEVLRVLRELEPPQVASLSQASAIGFFQQDRSSNNSNDSSPSRRQII